MAMKNPYSQYKQNSVMTASPQELTLMLYNGALKFLKQAMLFIDEKKIEKSHNSIVRTQDILVEFMSTVDQNYEVGKNLFSLYEYMNYRLGEADMEKDKEKVEEIYSMIEELRDTWKQAMEKVKKGQA
ncbi:flagellar export chaperone FliS [Dethiothermospora halolimnae]|uniref:flagellar export chaperone FliS n=1 Tax=Dethiothermospora halolimnae TaxID=3114390 RepID=UPI003CCB79BB